MVTRPKSAFLKACAKSLAPAIKDTRKFRLAKPMILSAEDAQKLAHAFNEMQSLTSERLTLQKMLLTMVDNTVSATKLTADEVASAEATMAALFAQQGASTHAVVLG